MTRSPSDAHPLSAQAIQQWLVNHIAESLALDPKTLDLNADFTDFGLNSAEMVNISGELELLLNRTIDPTLVLEYPNIAALSEFLANLPTAEATPASGHQNSQAMLANLDQMSDDEVEGLLESLLSEKS